jgi:hypothetical protein
LLVAFCVWTSGAACRQARIDLLLARSLAGGNLSAVYAACVWKQMLNIIHFGRGVKELEIILLIPERPYCCYLVLPYTLPESWHIVHASKLDLPLHLGRVLVVARAKVCGFLLAPSPVPAWHSHLLLAPFMPLLGDLRLRGLCAILSCLC